MSDDGSALAQRFTVEIPDRFNFARDVLDGLAADPAKLAIWWIDTRGSEQQVTFADIAERSSRAAGLLAAEGVRRGDVVVVLLPRVVEWWVMNMACMRLGAVISPAPAQLRTADIEYRLVRSGATCVVASDEAAPRVEAALERCPEVRGSIIVGAQRPGWKSLESALADFPPTCETADTAADETAAIYFTSGTEGQPKMVAHTHVSYPLRHKLTGEYWLDLHDGDLHWNLSDTGWAKAGWSSLFGPWHRGATVFVVDAPRFDPGRVIDLLERYPIDTMCAAPTVYRALVLEDRATIRPARLRHCVAAGEPLNPEVMAQWKAATGITIRDGYGQTESSLLVVNFPTLEPRPGSMGKPVPGYDVQIIDANGTVQGPGVEGDIALRVEPQRPLGLFKEYVDDPGANAAAYRGDWYLPGDRAYRDEDGFFWFVGRADDVIITAGYRVGPFEVESALIEHPAVAESAVVASPDPVRGQVVKAFVVLRDGFEPTDELAGRLQRHVKATTAPYKYPRKIEFVAALPKTDTGKIKRAALRRREARRGKSP